MTSVTAARAADSSTIVWSAANVATRTWSARLFTARGSPRLVWWIRGGRVVAEQLVAAANELDVVAEVVLGLGLGHAGQGVAEHDPLVEGGEAPELDPAPQHGLAEEQPGERRDTVHLRIRVNDETPVLPERFRVIGDSLLCE